MLLVGHVTKEGAIAGPRVLEHLVDVVLQFEGERDAPTARCAARRIASVRPTRSASSRCARRGLVEVGDASVVVRGRDGHPPLGSVVPSTLEGTRPLLVEVQALVASKRIGRRRVASPSGIDRGDKVVYPHHGAGKIVKKEKKEILGQQREYLTIQILYNDMTVMVPSENADRAGLRKVIGEETVDEVLAVLRDDGSADAEELEPPVQAQPRQDQDRRHLRARRGRAEPVDPGARQGPLDRREADVRRAKKILASELMYARDMDEDEAIDFLENLLEDIGRRGRPALADDCPRAPARRRCGTPGSPDGVRRSRRRGANFVRFEHAIRSVGPWRSGRGACSPRRYQGGRPRPRVVVRALLARAARLWLVVITAAGLLLGYLLGGVLGRGSLRARGPSTGPPTRRSGGGAQGGRRLGGWSWACGGGPRRRRRAPQPRSSGPTSRSVVLVVAYVFSRIAAAQARRHPAPGRDPLAPQLPPVPPRLVDTSAIIDGRLVDVVRTKFLSGAIVVPTLRARRAAAGGRLEPTRSSGPAAGAASSSSRS